jgi:hypothetical protein
LGTLRRPDPWSLARKNGGNRTYEVTPPGFEPGFSP